MVWLILGCICVVAVLGNFHLAGGENIAMAMTIVLIRIQC